MTDFAGKSFEYLQGYHAAMAEISELVQDVTSDAADKHLVTPSGLFGGPRPLHHQTVGEQRAARRIGDHAFQQGQRAFAARKAAS